MLGWLRRIEMGTTTYQDAQAAGLWLAAAWFTGLLMGIILVLLVLHKS